MKKAILIGCNGQLGTELTKLWPTRPGLAKRELVGLTHAELDITNEAQVTAAVEELRPEIVINTAGFLRVDECERVPDHAMLVNGIALKYLAAACAKHRSVLVHFSTDYVFDGTKGSAYEEGDASAPVNAYGVSKLAGEQFVRYGRPDDHMIVRTSGLYGPAGSASKGGNFIETMLRLAAAGKSLAVVDDQVFSPAYAPDLAASVLRLIEDGARGTFHVTNAGATSWYAFAERALQLAGLKPELRPVSTAEYAAPAARPRYSVLDNAKAHSAGLPQARPWEDALAEYMSVRGA
jgi:dTDP-4-dehydrorhamnose reductase